LLYKRAILLTNNSRYTFPMINILKLDLRSPLFFSLDARLHPFQPNEPEGETLFCFEVAPSEAASIEPDAARFLGPLLFAGRRVSTANAPPQPTTRFELPAGVYLFAQERRALGLDDWLFLALETQKEGLWERLSLGNRVYLRRLFEDDSAVTQVFRPLF
jgi:hypothetical protein